MWLQETICESGTCEVLLPDGSVGACLVFGGERLAHTLPLVNMAFQAKTSRWWTL